MAEEKACFVTKEKVEKCDERRVALGSVIYIRYLDHVLFKDADPSLYKPFIREALGWLDYEDDTCIRLVWERYAEPAIREESKPRATGLIILKSAILEMRKIE